MSSTTHCTNLPTRSNERQLSGNTPRIEFFRILLDIYKERHITIAEQPCLRSEQYGTERVFVVARSGSQLIIFDDVEDEFAVGAPSEDGILREWKLCGDLMDALRQV